MQSPDTYSYFMKVDGTIEEQEQIFNLLSASNQVIGIYLSPDGPTECPYSSYSFPTSGNHTYEEWNEQDMDELLHQIAVQVPSASLTIDARNEDDPSYAFSKRFHGELYQETRLTNYMPPLREDGDIPFNQRNDISSSDTPPQRTMYVLCEEYVDEYDIPEFKVLGVSEHKKLLQSLMQAKIDKDPYGFIADKGIQDESTDYFATNFENGQVKYYILDEEILTKEKIQEMLQSEEYDPTFLYPDNMPDILIAALQQAAQISPYGSDTIHTDRALPHILQDKQFQSLVKQSYWYSRERIEGSYKVVKQDFYQFIREKLDKNPDYLEHIGAIPPFQYPDNLRDILISSIYDVSRNLHLPVADPQEQADRFLRNADFRSRMKFENTSSLIPESEEYISASRSCHDFLKEHLIPKQNQTKKPLDDIIASAQSEQKQLSPETFARESHHTKTAPEK